MADTFEQSVLAKSNGTNVTLNLAVGSYVTPSRSSYCLPTFTSSGCF